MCVDGCVDVLVLLCECGVFGVVFASIVSVCDECANVRWEK